MSLTTPFRRILSRSGVPVPMAISHSQRQRSASHRTRTKATHRTCSLLNSDLLPSESLELGSGWSGSTAAVATTAYELMRSRPSAAVYSAVLTIRRSSLPTLRRIRNAIAGNTPWPGHLEPKWLRMIITIISNNNNNNDNNNNNNNN